MSTMSPFWKPKLCAAEPFSTSVTATPAAAESSRNSSAKAGERFATLAPSRGERVLMTVSSRGVSGAVSSATGSLISRPPRMTPSWAWPPGGLVAKR
jgi:hypothetical protein